MENLTKTDLAVLAMGVENLDQTIFKKAVSLAQVRLKKLSDFIPLCSYLFIPPLEFEVELTDADKEVLMMVANQMEGCMDWTTENIGKELEEAQLDSGLSRSKFFALVRMAISGKKIGLPLNESMEIIGRNDCLIRLMYYGETALVVLRTMKLLKENKENGVIISDI